MRKWVVILILGGCLLGGAFVFLNNKNQKKDVFKEVLVEVSAVDEIIEAAGEVAPLNRVEIKPPVSGRIERYLVDEGSSVKQGQIMAWMSSSDRAAIIDSARSKGPEEAAKWEDTYKPTPIMAPLSGTVILRNAVQGQTVDLSTVLFALSDQLIVVSYVDEIDIGRIKMNMPVRITLDSYPDKPFDGVVFNILFEGKNVSNVITYGVKIRPIKPPPFFRSQMTAHVKFLISERSNVILVPALAVSDSPTGGKQVFLKAASGPPVATQVEIGPQTGSRIEIINGLKPGDTLIVPQRVYQKQKEGPSSPLVMSGPRNRR